MNYYVDWIVAYIAYTCETFIISDKLISEYTLFLFICFFLFSSKVWPFRYTIMKLNFKEALQNKIKLYEYGI